MCRPRALVPSAAIHGYSVSCDDGGLEPGHEKVALYVLDGKPTHAARQLPDGAWTSKLGRQIDIAHTVCALEGPAYGQIAVFLKRKKRGGVERS